MNKIMINGRLIREPEFQALENNNSRCTVFIANDVYQGTKKVTGFYRCVAWGKLGQIIADNAKTGTELFITGHLEQHRYEDESGKMVYDVGIVIEQFDFGAKAIEKQEGK